VLLRVAAQISIAATKNLLRSFLGGAENLSPGDLL